jgi:hypothetical protein
MQASSRPSHCPSAALCTSLSILIDYGSFFFLLLFFPLFKNLFLRRSGVRRYIRPEAPFTTLAALVARIHQDAAATKHALGLSPYRTPDGQALLPLGADGGRLGGGGGGGLAANGSSAAEWAASQCAASQAKMRALADDVYLRPPGFGRPPWRSFLQQPRTLALLLLLTLPLLPLLLRVGDTADEVLAAESPLALARRGGASPLPLPLLLLPLRLLRRLAAAAWVLRACAAGLAHRAATHAGLERRDATG